jgi:hypothetical protein
MAREFFSARTSTRVERSRKVSPVGTKSMPSRLLSAATWSGDPVRMFAVDRGREAMCLCNNHAHREASPSPCCQNARILTESAAPVDNNQAFELICAPDAHLLTVSTA